MRLLYVITDLEIGGVPLHLTRLATAIQGAGHEVRVVALAPPGPAAERLRSAGIPVDSCHAHTAMDVRVLWRLRRRIRAFRPDLVHALLFHANLACRLASAVQPRRLLCEIQTLEIERPWHLTVDRWTTRLCRLTIGNSAAVVDHLHNEGGIPRERLRVVPGGIDPTGYRDVTAVSRAALRVPADVPLIGWVGRLDPVKGLPCLLEAVAALPRAHVALVGQGPQRDDLVAVSRNLGIDERVHLLGVRHDVPALLHAFDVFAFPSLTEGLPNALMEAMAAARPIVCTDIPGNRALIDPNVHGLCVAPHDVGALCEALEQLVNDPVRAAELGQRARSRVERRFGLEAMVRRYMDLYAEAL